MLVRCCCFRIWFGLISVVLRFSWKPLPAFMLLFLLMTLFLCLFILAPTLNLVLIILCIFCFVAVVRPGFVRFGAGESRASNPELCTTSPQPESERRVRNLSSPVPDTPSLFDENGMEFREHSRILGLGRTRGVPPRRGMATKMHPSRMTMLHVSGHPRLEVWRGRCDNTSFRGNRGQ